MEFEMFIRVTNEQIEKAAEEEMLRKEDETTEGMRKKVADDAVAAFNRILGKKLGNNFYKEAKDIILPIFVGFYLRVVLLIMFVCYIRGCSIIEEGRLHSAYLN